MSRQASQSLTHVPSLEQLPELASACAAQVERAVGLAPDEEVETLPLLDHYVRISRDALGDRPELLPLLQRTVGAYFGRVLAGHLGAGWVLLGPDVHTWFVACKSVCLAVNPVGIAHAALTWGLPPELVEAGPSAELLLAREERSFIEQRLAALPQVQEGDYFTLSTRLETLEIVHAALAELAVQKGDADTEYEVEDYRELVLQTAYAQTH